MAYVQFHKIFSKAAAEPFPNVRFQIADEKSTTDDPPCNQLNNQRLMVGLFEEIARGSMTDGKIDRRGPVERFIPVYLPRPCRTVDDCGRRIPHQKLYTDADRPIEPLKR